MGCEASSLVHTASENDNLVADKKFQQNISSSLDHSAYKLVPTGISYDEWLATCEYLSQ